RKIKSTCKNRICYPRTWASPTDRVPLTAQREPLAFRSERLVRSVIRPESLSRRRPPIGKRLHEINSVDGMSREESLKARGNVPCCPRFCPPVLPKSDVVPEGQRGHVLERAGC